MWKRFTSRFRQKGVTLLTAVVLAMAMVERRGEAGNRVVPIVLRQELLPQPAGMLWGVLPPAPGVFPSCWLN